MSQGLWFVLIFDVLSAAQSVWLGSLLQGMSFYNVLFVNFLIVTACFALLSLYKRGEWKSLGGRGLLLFAALNVGTVGTWMCLYVSLHLIEPALTAATLYGINPLATLLVSLLVSAQARRFTRSQLAISMLTILSMLAVAYTLLESRSSAPSHRQDLLLLGFAMAICTGFFLAFVNVVSRRIYDEGYKLHQLMSLRFFLLLVVTFALGSDIVPDFGAHPFAFLIIALAGNVLPLFMLQKGISLSRPIQVSYILLLTPLFVFGFEFLDRRLIMSLNSLMAIVGVVVLSIVGLRLEKAQA